MTPSLAKCLLVTLAGILVLPVSSSAQNPGGQRPQDKPGVALVKPQAWSKDDQATVMEFLSYEDHSGYYDFKTVKNPSFQVPTPKLVKLLVYPESPSSICTSDQRAALQKTLDEFGALSARFPSASRYLDKAMAPLKSDAEKFDAGSVKEAGQWLARSTYFKQKAASLANMLRPELVAAPKIKEVDLSTNQYFLGLQELAKTEPSVKPTVDSIRALYDSLVRKEDRLALLAQLNAPGLSYDKAVELVRQLKALNPDEDARTNLYVQSWDAAVAKAGLLTTQIDEVQSQFETAMGVPDGSAKVPVISPELSAGIEKMSDAVRQFRAGSPPAVIQVPLSLADALTSCGDNFPPLAKLVQSREYLDAKAMLDPLSGKASLIGPKSAAVLSALQKKLAGDIEKFRVLRDEAKMLAGNDKIEEALKKYEQAYAIIPAKDVSAQIELLKKQ